MSFRLAVLALEIFALATAPTPAGPRAATNKSAGLRLEVMESTELIPGLSPPSKLFVANLYNNSAVAVTLESVQMPGGYVGSGQFYPCSTEARDFVTRRWQTLHFAKLSDFGLRPRIEETHIPSGKYAEVCRTILPSQGGSPNACLRFSLRFRWKDTEAAIVSHPFVIDVEPVTAKRRAACASLPPR